MIISADDQSTITEIVWVFRDLSVSSTLKDCTQQRRLGPRQRASSALREGGREGGRERGGEREGETEGERGRGRGREREREKKKKVVSH